MRLNLSTQRIPHRLNRGFTMVEVLIAMLVLAIGLLGLAALQAQTLRFNHDAYLRTQATLLTYDIIERMRTARAINAVGYEAGDPGTACDPSGAGITNDLACWHRDVRERLPGGIANIDQDAANPTLYAITVSWLDRESESRKGQQWAIEVN